MQWDFYYFSPLLPRLQFENLEANIEFQHLLVHMVQNVVILKLKKKFCVNEKCSFVSALMWIDLNQCNVKATNEN